VRWSACRGRWPNAEFSRFVCVAPVRWHLQEAGRGPLVLLLHGAGASTHTWRDVLPRLARQHRVVAVDLPGQGFSHTGRRDRCGLVPMATDLGALLAACGIAPDVLVGHSAGAALALRLAIDLPQTSRAVIAINGALGSFRGQAGHLFPALARALARGSLAPNVFSLLGSSRRVVRRLIESTGSRLDERGIELYRSLLSDREHVAGTLAMMASWDVGRLTSDLPRVAAPTLLLAGQGDLAVPPATSEIAARAIPGALFRCEPRLGHLMHEERPAWAAEMIAAFAADALVGGGARV
jgi:magnesium chelatase accessory protein